MYNGWLGVCHFFLEIVKPNRLKASNGKQTANNAGATAVNRMNFFCPNLLPHFINVVL